MKTFLILGQSLSTTEALLDLDPLDRKSVV